jgi:hypothetical protein
MKTTPSLVAKNKSLCKAVSLLPIKSKSLIPVAYIKAIPIIFSVAVCIVLVAIPYTRNVSANFSVKTFDNFSSKTNQLKEEFVFSIRTGITAYKDQVRDNIKILPIDTYVEPELYLGRVEKPYSFSEKSHLMTASIYKGFEYFK